MPTNTSEAASGGERIDPAMLDAAKAEYDRWSKGGDTSRPRGERDWVCRQNDNGTWAVTTYHHHYDEADRASHEQALAAAVQAALAAVPAAPVGGEGSRTGAIRDDLIAFLAARFFLSPGQCGGHADALMSQFIAPLIARAAAAEAERDEALKVGIKAGIDAAIRGIDATVLNLGSECGRRGIQDRETGEVPCDGEEDRGCACSEALELGDRLIKNLRTCDVAKIAALTQPATPATDEATR